MILILKKEKNYFYLIVKSAALLNLMNHPWIIKVTNYNVFKILIWILYI